MTRFQALPVFTVERPSPTERYLVRARVELEPGEVLGFIPVRRKEQEVFGYGVALVWVFCPNLSADAFYRRQDIDSNSASFRSDRNQVGGGITFRF